MKSGVLTSAILSAAIISLGATQVQAVPITYTFTGEDVSGSLNGISFEDQSVSFVFKGDTDDVEPAAPGGSGNFNTTSNDNLTATFSIGSLYSGFIEDMMQVINKNYGAGFGHSNRTIATIYSGIGPNDMMSDYMYFGDWNVFSGAPSMNTTAGILSLDAGRIDGDTGTFTSQIDVVASVPEPGTLALLGLGLIGLGAGQVRRKRV